MAAPREGGASTLLYDGRVLVTGGWSSDGGVVDSAERFTPNGGAFLATPAMPVARANHTATLLPDGRVLVAGGVGADGRALALADVYDPFVNAWSAAGSMYVARAEHTATTLRDGRILFAGGADAGQSIDSLELFDPDAGTFLFLDVTLASPRTGHAAALLPGGQVLIAGGYDGTQPLSSADVYDAATSSLTAASPLSTPRMGHSATTLLSGRVLVTGGEDASGALASAEIYDAATNTFSSAGDAMLDARRGHQAILLPHNNQVLIFGGTAGGGVVPSAEAFLEGADGEGVFVGAVAPATARAGASAAALSFPADAWTRTGPNDGLLLLTGGRTSSAADSAVATSELYGFATVTTDLDDYSPGMTVTISGAGWEPGEAVALTLDEYPIRDTHTLSPVIADASGRIVSTEFAPDDGDVGVLFRLTAIGAYSRAQTAFSDSKSLSISFGGTGSGSVQLVDTTNPSKNTTCSSPRACSPNLGNNDVGTLTATAAAGSAFGGWSGMTSGVVCAGTTCSFSMGNGLQRVTATFIPATTLTVTTATGTYGGSTGSIRATLRRASNGTAISNKTITFSLNGATVGTAVTNSSGVATLNSASLTNPAKINAGTYATGVGAIFAGDATFAGSTAVNTLSVNPRAITVTAVTNTKTYDGSTSAVGVPTITSGTLVSGDSATWSESYATKHAGTGKTLVPAGTVDDGNGGANYAVTFVSVTTGTIARRPLTVTAVTNTKIYDGTTSATGLPTITSGTLAPGDTATWTESYATKSVGLGDRTLVPAGAVADGNGGLNYLVTFVNVTTGTITAAPLTITGVTANDKVYDASAAATLNTGAAALSGVQGSDNVTLNVAGVIATFADATVGAAKPVTVAGFAVAGGDASNYTLTQPGGLSASITARGITVTADPKSKVYGNPDPPLTYAVTSGALQGTDTLSGGLSRAAGEAAGTYAIGSTLANGNYAITFVAANLTITARAITVAANAATKTYGDSDPPLTYQITAGVLQGTDVLAGGLSRAPGEAVGSYTISSTLASPNYEVTFVPAALTITPRAITVAADAAAKTYGDSDPPLTYQITAGVLQGTDVLAGGLSRAPGEAVGSYTISSTLASPNYDVTFVAATLTITPRAIRVTAYPTSKIYGSPDPPLTYALTSGALQGADTLSGGLVRASGEGVGSYTIGSTLANGNYAITFVPAIMTILPRALSATIAASDKVYDGTVSATALGTLAGVIGDDDVEMVVLGATFNDANVGTGKPVTATVALSGADAGNYTVNTTAAATAAIMAGSLTASFVNPGNDAANVDLSQPISWTAVGAQAYYLYLGSAPGARNLLDTGELQTTSYLARTVPANTLVYARLWTKMNGVWRYVDITFTTGSGNGLAFTYPPAGASAADLTMPFTWTTVPNAQAYYLYLGTTPGSSNLVNTGEIQSSFYLATGLPVGQPVYARLWVKVAGSWSYIDRTIVATATVSMVAQFTFPANGAVNVDVNQSMTWTPIAGAEKYYLYVGTTLGAKNLVDSGEITGTSYLAPHLPKGPLLYARLWTKASGTWRYTDISFIAAAPAAGLSATMVSPADGQTGVAPNGVIQWNTVPGAQKYYVYAGTTPGAKDLIDSEEICNGCTVSPMVTSWNMLNGGKSPGLGSAQPNQLVYVRLWTVVENVWRFTDATFRLAP